MTKEPQPPALQVVMKEARRAVKPLIWFSAGINVLMLTGALYMLQVYHRVLSSHSLETLVMLSLMAAGALIAMAGLEVVRARLLATVGAWMNARLAPVLLTASVEHAAAAPGQTNARPLRDLDQVRSFFTSPSIFPILDAPWAPLFFAAIFLMHPWLGWLALGGGVVLFALALLNEYVTRKPLAAAAGAQTRAYAQAEQAIRNAEVVQAMGMLKPLLEGWKAQQDEANGGQVARRQPGRRHLGYRPLPPARPPDGRPRPRRLSGAEERGFTRRHDRRINPDGPGLGPGRTGDRHVEGDDRRTGRLQATCRRRRPAAGSRASPAVAAPDG